MTHTLFGGSVGLLVGVAGSCNRNLEQQCYEELAPLEREPGTLAPDLPYCEGTVSTVPGPPADYGFVHLVSTAFVPTPQEPCDPCDVERLDELLRTEISARMSQGSPSCARKDPSDPVGLCVHPPDETSEQCRVLGVFYSNYHDVPVEHGCGDCRDNGTCDHNP